MENIIRKDKPANMSGYERVGGALGGAALLAFGLRKMSFTGFLLAAGGAFMMYRGASGNSFVYRKLGIDTTSAGLSRGIELERTITVYRPREEAYRFWTDLENLPKFMNHLESVSFRRDGTSEWVAREGLMRLRWRAEVVEDIPNECISWRSLPDGDLEHYGSVEFRSAPGNRGTEVRCRVRYAPPGGRLAMALGPFLQKLTKHQLARELHRFKQLLETGEVATPLIVAPSSREQRTKTLDMPAMQEVYS